MGIPSAPITMSSRYYYYCSTGEEENVESLTFSKSASQIEMWESRRKRVSQKKGCHRDLLTPTLTYLLINDIN